MDAILSLKLWKSDVKSLKLSCENNNFWELSASRLYSPSLHYIFMVLKCVYFQWTHLLILVPFWHPTERNSEICSLVIYFLEEILCLRFIAWATFKNSSFSITESGWQSRARFSHSGAPQGNRGVPNNTHCGPHTPRGCLPAGSGRTLWEPLDWIIQFDKFQTSYLTSIDSKLQVS